MIVSAFKVEHIGFTGEWESKVIYYYGDLSNVILQEDWRFCKVKNRRKQAIFLGVEDRIFPELSITNYE